ncbi:MAG: hypothetical protein EOP83_04195 [Verrucomicrobiaceae bacterium]|nr:MAG: hypothetical protein EOP83_04195 [Verrucomicrobiaceae bacterium]
MPGITQTDPTEVHQHPVTPMECGMFDRNTVDNLLKVFTGMVEQERPDFFTPDREETFYHGVIAPVKARARELGINLLLFANDADRLMRDFRSKGFNPTWADLEADYEVRSVLRIDFDEEPKLLMHTLVIEKTDDGNQRRRRMIDFALKNWSVHPNPSDLFDNVIMVMATPKQIEMITTSLGNPFWLTVKGPAK